METNDRADLKKQVLDEMNARRVNGKTYIDSEWLLNKLLTTHEREVREKTLKEVYQMLLRTEAVLAQRGIDVPDEYSEEGYYNRGYFEAIDDTAKRINELLLSEAKQ